MKSGNRISSPEGIRRLMQEIWERHQVGHPQSPNNIFFVDLPEPTEEEKEEMRRNRAERAAENMQINSHDLIHAVNKLRGW